MSTATWEFPTWPLPETVHYIQTILPDGRRTLVRVLPDGSLTPPRWIPHNPLPSEPSEELP